MEMKNGGSVNENLKSLQDIFCLAILNIGKQTRDAGSFQTMVGASKCEGES